MARYGALFAVVSMTLIGATNVGPAWAAHNGRGIRGTWTATAQRCGKSCHLVGDFVPVTTIGTPTPTVFDAPIGGGSASSAVGDSEPAIDVAGHIYPEGGGTAWISYSFILTLGTVGLGLWTWFAIRRLRRRRAM